MANTMTSRFFPVQAVHLGVTGAIATFNQATLPFDIPQAAGSSSTFGIGGGLGAVIEDSGKVYRLVKKHKVTASVTTSAGFVAYWQDRANAVVVSDQTDSQAAVNAVAGAFLGAVTDENYCFIQIGGSQTVGSKDATSAGDMLFGSTTDGQLATIAAGSTVTNIPFAVAYGTASGNLVAAYWLLGNLL